MNIVVIYINLNFSQKNASINSIEPHLKELEIKSSGIFAKIS